MSEPRRVIVESIEAQFRRMGIPQELNPNWGGKIHCGFDCPKCRGSRPGCKCNPLERIRREIMDIIQNHNLKYYRYFKRNFCTLFFIFRVGYNHFRFYGSKISMMNETQAALMNFASKQRSMLIRSKEICEVNWQLPILVPRLFPGLNLSREQFKLMCDWMEDDFPVVPRCIWKKMLMTSIALGFLVKRLVGPIVFLRVKMFHSIFKQTLVRKRNSPSIRTVYQPFHDEDFLDVFFQKPRLFRRGWGW